MTCDKMYINGKMVEGKGGEFSVINPATGKVIQTLRAADESQAEEKVVERFAMPVAQAPSQPKRVVAPAARFYQALNLRTAEDTGGLDIFWVERLREQRLARKQIAPLPFTPMPPAEHNELKTPGQPAAKTGQTAITEPQNPSIHCVQKGETLWGIARWYTGTGFNYQLLADTNAIADPDVILPGQRVIIIENQSNR